MTRTSPAPSSASPVSSSGPGLRTLVRQVDRSYLGLDAAARLPTAMLPLGLLLYVADLSGSYGTGGLAVAALSIGGGVGGSAVGLAADRFGQRPVLLAATFVQVVALAALLGPVAGAPLGLVLTLAAVIGLANPQPGAMSRSRWADLARPRPDRRAFVGTAMAFEGALDETSFVLGPLLVGTVAGLASPTWGLLVALVVAALAQTGFALHRSALAGSRPSARRVTSDRRRTAPVAYLGCLLVAMASVGLVFGATQTGVAARMAETGDAALTGPVYAAMGVGSAITGLLTTRLAQVIALETRIALSGLVLLLVGAGAALASAPLPLALACLVLGVALAPALISSFAAAERAAPAGLETTTMTALSTANVVGVAAGAALAGVLVDRVAPGAALLIDAGAGALVLLGGLAARSTAARYSARFSTPVRAGVLGAEPEPQHGSAAPAQDDRVQP